MHNRPEVVLNKKSSVDRILPKIDCQTKGQNRFGWRGNLESTGLILGRGQLTVCSYGGSDAVGQDEGEEEPVEQAEQAEVVSAGPDEAAVRIPDQDGAEHSGHQQTGPQQLRRAHPAGQHSSEN